MRRRNYAYRAGQVLRDRACRRGRSVRAPRRCGCRQKPNRGGGSRRARTASSPAIPRRGRRQLRAAGDVDRCVASIAKRKPLFPVAFNHNRRPATMPFRDRGKAFACIVSRKLRHFTSTKKSAWEDGMRTQMMRIAVATLFVASAAGVAQAEKKYDPGASDTEIKVGNIMPYSGPASSYGVIGKTEAAYFKMINDEGGINGRKINFISYDDAYSPPKAIEQARKLVESDEVLLIFQSLGT